MMNLLKNKYKDTWIRDIPLDVVYESQMQTLLSDYWISLGEQFSESLEDFNFIKHSVVPSYEKIVMIWTQLQNSTNPVSISQFIQALEKIIPSIRSFQNVAPTSTPSMSSNINRKRVRSHFETTDDSMEIEASGSGQKPRRYVNNNEDPNKWTFEELSSWLKEEKLSELEQIFRDEDISGDVLLSIPEADWIPLIPKLGTRFLISAYTVSQTPEQDYSRLSRN